MGDYFCCCDEFGPITGAMRPAITGATRSWEPCPPEHMRFCMSSHVPHVYDTGRAVGVRDGMDAFVDFDGMAVLLRGRTHLGA